MIVFEQGLWRGDAWQLCGWSDIDNEDIILIIIENWGIKVYGLLRWCRRIEISESYPPYRSNLAAEWKGEKYRTAGEKEENVRTFLQSTDLISPPQLFPFIDNV